MRYFDVRLSGKSADGHDMGVIRAAVVSDAPLGALRLDDVAVAVIDGHMTGVDDNVAGLRLGQGADPGSQARPAAGGAVSAAVVSGVLQDLPYEVRAVDAVRQGVAAPDVGIADPLLRVGDDLRSGAAGARRTAARGRRAARGRAAA